MAAKLYLYRHPGNVACTKGASCTLATCEEIEVDVTDVKVARAEPDVGIFSACPEDFTVKALTPYTLPLELTGDETERVLEWLGENWEPTYPDEP